MVRPDAVIGIVFTVGHLNHQPPCAILLAVAWCSLNARGEIAQ
jgi:hypothetical protein